MTQTTWVTTPAAARLLGVKADTLKRSYAHPETGFLKEGKHWRRGLYHNSPRGWDVEACRKEMEGQGFIVYADRQEAESVQT